MVRGRRTEFGRATHVSQRDVIPLQLIRNPPVKNRFAIPLRFLQVLDVERVHPGAGPVGPETKGVGQDRRRTDSSSQTTAGSGLPPTDSSTYVPATLEGSRNDSQAVKPNSITSIESIAVPARADWVMSVPCVDCGEFAYGRTGETTPA